MAHSFKNNKEVTFKNLNDPYLEWVASDAEDEMCVNKLASDFLDQRGEFS